MCEENDFVYQVTIFCDDNINIVIYTNGPKDCENELLDFMHQQYCDAQPDITKYKILNLSKDFDEIQKKPLRAVHVHLAIKAIEYAEDYQ
jgi:hypothetical protein